VSRAAGEGPQARQLKDPRGPVAWSRQYLTSAWDAWRGPGLPDIECFCLFIGYARSGHSLIGSLLNAHPEVVVSHELDAVRYVERGFSRSQLYALILRRDRVFGSMDRVWTGYDYNVPGQHQGGFSRLRVIGDKRGRTTALELGARADLLDRLRRKVGIPLRFVHVTRNPFDNIATEAVRRRLSLANATAWYEESCRAVAAVRPRLAPDELIELPYESFAADPKSSLAELCRFLGVEADAPYLDDCAGIVWASTSRRRDAVDWSTADRRSVEDLVARYSFLGQYRFDG
jgi:Sulfotransferase family